MRLVNLYIKGCERVADSIFNTLSRIFSKFE